VVDLAGRRVHRLPTSTAVSTAHKGADAAVGERGSARFRTVALADGRGRSAVIVAGLAAGASLRQTGDDRRQ
jgi:putative NIF3 family GTP cyclohydrolase 1 type 2